MNCSSRSFSRSPSLQYLSATTATNLLPKYSAGELTTEELERIVTIIQNPTQYKIPVWFLNRQRDIVDGKDSQVLANGVDSKLRDDLERLKKIKCHRGLRHYYGLRVRGQHTKTTGMIASFFYPSHLMHMLTFFFLYRPQGTDRWCLQEEGLNLFLCHFFSGKKFCFCYILLFLINIGFLFLGSIHLLASCLVWDFGKPAKFIRSGLGLH